MNSEPTPSQPSSRKSDRAPQIEEYKPPVVREDVPPLKIAPYIERPNEFHSARRDSVKSGRSNGSASSRSRGTRVKTISLKELEQPE